MVRRDSKVEEIKQRIDEDLNIDLVQYPSAIKRWFTTNLLQRVLSYLVAFTEEGAAIKLKATASGLLKIAVSGTGFEFVTVKTGTAGISESAAIVFDEVVSRIRFVAVDYDMLFRPSRDGVIFQDQIYIFAGKDFQLDLVCKAFKVQRVTINDASYRIEGYR